MPKGKNQKIDQIGEILEVVNFIKDNAVGKSEFQELKEDVSSLKEDVSSLKEDVSSLKKEVISIKSQMVTKDYLDTKLADLRGDLVVLLRKEDVKLKTLVNILETKKVISKSDVNKLSALEPFPQLAL